MTDYHEPSVGDEIHVSADELRQRLGDGDWSTVSTAELRALRARVAELETDATTVREAVMAGEERIGAAERRGYDRAIAALTRVLDGEPRGVTDSGAAGEALDRVEAMRRSERDEISDRLRAMHRRAQKAEGLAARLTARLAKRDERLAEAQRALESIRYMLSLGPGSTLQPVLDGIRQLASGEDCCASPNEEIGEVLGMRADETPLMAARRVARERTHESTMSRLRLERIRELRAGTADPDADIRDALLGEADPDEESPADAIRRIIEERDGLADRCSRSFVRFTEIAIAVRDALPTIRAGLDAGGGHAPEAVRARIAAVDAVHALADALEGEETHDAGRPLAGEESEG